MKRIKTYNEFLNESSSANSDDDLCRFIFKDLVKHLRGLPYEIITDYATFNTDFEEEAEEDGDDWLTYENVNLELVIKVNNIKSLPDHIKELLIESDLYTSSQDMLDDVDGDEDLLDMLGLGGDDKLEITILGIGVNMEWSLQNYGATYDSPADRESTLDEVEYSVSPIIINLQTAQSSIELEISDNDPVLGNDLNRFEYALHFYKDPGTVEYALNSSAQNSDTFREKARLRSKN